MNKARFTPAQINALGGEEFVRVIGPVFESSPWIAEETWQRRPFATLNELHRALCEVVDRAGADRQLKLIQAHPDLVGRAALQGALTAESNAEQASAGLDRLSAEEVSLFQELNVTYREQFGFPFVICARLNKKEAIVRGFRERLCNSRNTEIRTALDEISKIARLRLEALIAD